MTGTHINYYRLCKRKLWLFANDIRMEQTSDLVKDGKQIEEESYLQRSERYSQVHLQYDFKGVTLSGKIDFFDTREKIVHEIKRSNKVENAHIFQVKFYLWLLMLNGIEAEKGIIEYPKMREREIVFLDEIDVIYLEKTVVGIQSMLQGNECPPVIHSKICNSCSYFEFCYSGEI